MTTPTPYVFPKDDTGQPYYMLADDPEHPGYVTFLPNENAHFVPSACQTGTKCELQLPPAAPEFYESPLVMLFELFGVVGIFMLTTKLFQWGRWKVYEYRHRHDDSSGGAS